MQKLNSSIQSNRTQWEPVYYEHLGTRTYFVSNVVQLEALYSIIHSFNTGGIDR